MFLTLSKKTMEEKTFKTYGEFHNYLKGYEFETKSGKRLSKLDVWCEHYKSPERISRIAENGYAGLTLVDKPGWESGAIRASSPVWHEWKMKMALRG